MAKKRQGYYIWVHVNPRAQAVPAVATPEIATQQAVQLQEQGEVVEVEVGGRKIRGRLIAVLESEKCILLKDESGKLHVIPLSALKRQSRLTVLV